MLKKIDTILSSSGEAKRIQNVTKEDMNDTQTENLTRETKILRKVLDFLSRVVHTFEICPLLETIIDAEEIHVEVVNVQVMRSCRGVVEEEDFVQVVVLQVKGWWGRGDDVHVTAVGGGGEDGGTLFRRADKFLGVGELLLFLPLLFGKGTLQGAVPVEVDQTTFPGDDCFHLGRRKKRM